MMKIQWLPDGKSVFMMKIQWLDKLHITGFSSYSFHQLINFQLFNWLKQL